ncbi:hypothetical protein F2Q70_00025978 [Brassica cretica]|uniref:Epidermal patterning factor-like protein n=1 Tax=Brassica cretica TaxID=69181 RepID=A0A8S9LED8_BRACR|nr:hypothetical protein F2Q70_00025978 [Brassica cretica]
MTALTKHTVCLCLLVWMEIRTRPERMAKSNRKTRRTVNETAEGSASNVARNEAVGYWGKPSFQACPRGKFCVPCPDPKLVLTSLPVILLQMAKSNRNTRTVNETAEGSASNVARNEAVPQPEEFVQKQPQVLKMMKTE